MSYFLLLLIILSLNINGSSARKTYQLYSIPSFTIDVTVQPGLNRTNSTNELLDFGEKLKSLAHAHLFEAFTSELYRHGNTDGENSALDSIELDMAIYDEFNGEEIRGELVGHILFIEDQLNYLKDFEASPSFVRNIVKNAFGKDQLDAFFSRMRLLLPNVQGVRVTTEAEETTREPFVTSTVPTVVKDNKDSSRRKGKGSNVIVVPMAVAITALAVGLFAYFRRDKRLHKSGHLLMDIDQYSECSDDDAFFGDLHLLDEASYESYDTEEGLQFVPVPAKFDENCDKRTKATLKEVTPKRYVQPDSPFELLYGAAFSHRDAAKVARVHGYKPSKSKYVKIAGRKIKKKPPLKPMQSISEVQEESPNEAAQLLIDGNCSNTIENLTQTKEESGIYRDFEKHDGNLCTMSNEEMCESLPFQVENDDSPKKDEQIDSFVDKLENLILAKSRHYEEWKQVETELYESRQKNVESNAEETIESIMDAKVLIPPLDVLIQETEGDSSQDQNILGTALELNACSVEHMETEPLVSTDQREIKDTPVEGRGDDDDHAIVIKEDCVEDPSPLLLQETNENNSQQDTLTNHPDEDLNELEETSSLISSHEKDNINHETTPQLVTSEDDAIQPCEINDIVDVTTNLLTDQNTDTVSNQEHDQDGNSEAIFQTIPPSQEQVIQEITTVDSVFVEDKNDAGTNDFTQIRLPIMTQTEITTCSDHTLVPCCDPNDQIPMYDDVIEEEHDAQACLPNIA